MKKFSIFICIFFITLIVFAEVCPVKFIKVDCVNKIEIPKEFDLKELNVFCKIYFKYLPQYFFKKPPRGIYDYLFYPSLMINAKIYFQNKKGITISILPKKGHPFFYGGPIYGRDTISEYQKKFPENIKGTSVIKKRSDQFLEILNRIHLATFPIISSEEINEKSKIYKALINKEITTILIKIKSIDFHIIFRVWKNEKEFESTLKINKTKKIKVKYIY